MKWRKLSAWFDCLLFKILPPEAYLRLHGVEHYSEPPATVTVTYVLHGEEKQHEVEFGGAWAVVQMLPLWLRWGFVEPEGSERYFIPASDIRRLEWYDPVLEDSFEIRAAESEPRWAWFTDSLKMNRNNRGRDGPRPQAGTGR